MRIVRLNIVNFCGITDFSYECAESLNVLVGVNGAGKSTVLRAIDLLFSWYSARLKSATGKGALLTDDDITLGKSFCSLELALDNGTVWKLYKQRSSNRQKPKGKTSLEQLKVFVNERLLYNEQTPDMAYLPLFASYGVTRRVVDSTPLRVHKRHAMGMIDVYNREAESRMNFQAFFAWFREREDIENEQLRETGVLTEDRQLKAVRTAITTAIHGFTNLRVQRSPRSFVIEKDGVKMKFDQLSDGEKSYITLIADIARKLSMTHPNMENPLLGTGVILIDEIDLHLHPRWQRDVVPQICRVFPNCQFFISTHSPVVLSNVYSGNGRSVFLMRDGNAIKMTDNLYAKRIDKILSEEFELQSLRGTEAQKHIDAVWECLRAGDCTSEQFTTNLQWLRNNLEPSDSEFMQIAVQERLINQRKLV